MNSDNIQVSIIAPTYKEAENIPHLARQVHAALTAADLSYELIISDDVSDDGTEAICTELARELPDLQLRLHSRRANRGLSPAVIDGIGIAAGQVVVVIDADLSHPPEKIPDIVRPLLANQADFVVGSRYVKGGGLHESWPWWRWLNSVVATLPARGLVRLADPMSGFFALRRSDMPAPEKLSPIGYKIGLELLVKAGFDNARVREEPILFRDRQYGKSKMSMREMWNYIRHLHRLYHYRYGKPVQVTQFLMVGALGLVVDVAGYLLLLAAGVPHLLARAIAYFPAVTFNWSLNRVFTFSARPRRPLLSQWLQYSAVCIGGLVSNWGTYALLTEHTAFFAERHLAALFVGVVVGTLFNFVLSDKLVFRQR